MKQWKYTKGSEKDFEGAPEWATCACQGAHKVVYYENVIGTGRWQNKGSSGTGFDGTGGYPIIAQRQLIEIWNGEGLPPVGTVCEWLASGDHDWINVTVLGHDGEDTWLKPDDGTQSFVVSCAEDFRPVQNDREKAIEQMFYDLPEDMRIGKDIREAIYDAGWRNKPELVDGYDVHHWSSLAKERFHQFNALETEIIGVRRMVTDTLKHLESGMKYYRITKHDDI